MRRTHIPLALCILPLTSAISLANFEQITPALVSINCLLTWDSVIPSCTKADFAAGATCSAACVAGLQAISTDVNDECSGVEVSATTMLGRIFEGTLLSLLCPNNILTTTTSTTKQSTSTMTSKSSSTSTTSTSVLKTTTTTAKTTTTTTTPLKSTTTTTTTSISTASTSASTTLPASIDSTSVVSSSSTFTSKSTSTKSTAPATETAQAHLSEQQIQFEAVQNSGGGSPFDLNVIDSGGPSKIYIDLRALLAGLAIVMAFGF